MTVEVLEASTDRLPTEASFRFTLRPLLEATSLSLDSNRPRFGRVGQNIVVRNGLSPFGLIYMHAIRLPEDFLLARIASQILFSPHPPTPLCAVRCAAQHMLADGAVEGQSFTNVAARRYTREFGALELQAQLRVGGGA